ncbi:hypothetical protein H6G93_17910 [Nostoc sp. FACHB-973]|nr:hypothetical protein [Nostoc sp. FACHB-973]
MTGINDSLNWDLVQRQTYIATPGPETSYIPIPPISIICDSYLMMFGFRNDEAKSNWRFAARVHMKLLTLPSSTSEFMASVNAFSQGCGLRELTLIKFPNLGLLPFVAEIIIPKWHRQMYVEAWKYSGDEVDANTQSLGFIQSQLNQVESKIDAL